MRILWVGMVCFCLPLLGFVYSLKALVHANAGNEIVVFSRLSSIGISLGSTQSLSNVYIDQERSWASQPIIKLVCNAATLLQARTQPAT
ncbi:hypothetical protein BJX65DRAFT_249818 [Aspergillus insuetus]